MLTRETTVKTMVLTKNLKTHVNRKKDFCIRTQDFHLYLKILPKYRMVVEEVDEGMLQ